MGRKIASKAERKRRIGKGVKAAKPGTFSKRTEKMATYGPKKESDAEAIKREKKLLRDAAARKKKK